MMLDKGALLVFFCLTMQTACSPLYPALRFGQKASSSSSFILRSSADDGHVFPDTDGPLQLSVPLRKPPEERTARHADAIFTNSYRKVLGQISARKFLQTIMGKRLGDESAEESSQVSKRQASLHTDNDSWYLRQRAAWQYLTREQRQGQRLRRITTRRLDRRGPLCHVAVTVSNQQTPHF
ncbi:somatoliberin [Huso huso]|uniref:Somatoliberin n=1 Tax=Huso huso TaxID=61971 RepID=A0ABR0YHS3_HUSHU